MECCSAQGAVPICSAEGHPSLEGGCFYTLQVVKALLVLGILWSKQQAHWGRRMIIPDEDLEVLFLILGFIGN